MQNEEALRNDRDIVREIRNSQNGNVHTISAKEAYALADRIEAAHKREQEKETTNICKLSGEYHLAQRMLTILSKGIVYRYGFKTTEDADMVLDILSKCTEQKIKKHSDEWKTIGNRIDYEDNTRIIQRITTEVVV